MYRFSKVVDSEDTVAGFEQVAVFQFNWIGHEQPGAVSAGFVFAVAVLQNPLITNEIKSAL